MHGEQAGNSIADILLARISPFGQALFFSPEYGTFISFIMTIFLLTKVFIKIPEVMKLRERDYVFLSPRSLWAFGHGAYLYILWPCKSAKRIRNTMILLTRYM